MERICFLVNSGASLPWKNWQNLLPKQVVFGPVLTEFTAGAFPARLGGFNLDHHMALFLAVQHETTRPKPPKPMFQESYATTWLIHVDSC